MGTLNRPVEVGTDALLVGLLLFAPGSTAHSRRYQPAGRCGERLRLLLVPLSANFTGQLGVLELGSNLRDRSHAGKAADLKPRSALP